MSEQPTIAEVNALVKERKAEGRPLSLLAGDRWLPRDVARLCHDAGWIGFARLYVMVAIVGAESAYYDEAVGGPNQDGSSDYGLFQLNSSYTYGMTAAEFKAAAFDPPRAVVLARRKYVDAGYSFQPWYAGPDGNGSYARFLVKAIHGCCNYAKQRESPPLALVH